MAKFCKNCGTALPDGAAFCPECGTIVPIEIQAPPGATVTISDAPPTARFCRSCGARLRPGTTFCAQCGQKAGAASPAAEPKAPEQNTQKAAPKKAPVQKRAASKAAPKQAASAPAQAAPAAKSGTRGLSAFLALVMLIELAVAAFKYPGFLVEKPSDPYLYKPTTGQTGLTGSATGKPTSSTALDDEDLIESSQTEDLQLFYTQSQLGSAKVYTREVSWENPSADFGAVKVALDSWNLPEETDQVLVRTLPELTEGEEGWVIRAYDFSLASGAHEFSTDVAITIPHNGSDALSSCVWFNEETGRWEDVFALLSEGGKSYTIYADHFSLFGEKAYRFDAKTLELVESNVTISGLKDGIFVEVPRKGVDRMRWNVKIDYNRMWNLYQEKTRQEAEALLQRMRDYGADAVDIAESDAWISEEDTAQNYLGTGGAFWNSKGTGEGIGQLMAGIRETPAAGLMDKLFFVVDAGLTGIKIYQEAKKGNRDWIDTIKAFPDAVYTHKQAVAGVAVGGLALYVGGWIGALIGLLWWTGASLYNLSYDRTWVDVFQNPTVEDLYQKYYHITMRRMALSADAGDVKNYRNPAMKAPETLNEDDLASLQAAMKKARVNTTSAGLTDTPGRYRVRCNGWSDVFLTLLTVCSDNSPVYLEKVLDEFYWNYAYAFWELPKEQQDAFVIANSSHPGSEGVTVDYSNGLPEVSDADKNLYTQNLVDELKAATQPILIKALEALQRESCEAMMKELEQTMLPVMNCQLVFRVEDTSLKAGESFRDSIYNVDWKTLKGNERFVQGGEEIRYDDPKLRTPMCFVGTPEAALMLPLLPSDTLWDPATEKTPPPSHNRKENYYPYTTGFLPVPNQKNSVVLRCSYYHYVMMGAPSQMQFRDVRENASSVNSDLVASFRLPSMTSASTKQVYNKHSYRTTTVESIRVEKKVDVIVKIEPAMLEANLRVNWESESYYNGFIVAQNWGDQAEAHAAPKNISLKVQKDGKLDLLLPAIDDLSFCEDEGANDSSGEKCVYHYSRDALLLKGEVVQTETRVLDDQKVTLLHGIITSDADFVITEFRRYSYAEGDRYRTGHRLHNLTAYPRTGDSALFSKFAIAVFPDGSIAMQVGLVGDQEDWNGDERDDPYWTGTDLYVLELTSDMRYQEHGEAFYDYMEEEAFTWR